MYDYVIAGAGAAGCALAYRLSADPAIKVLLIEAGPKDRHPFIHMPRGIGKLGSHKTYTWTYGAASQASKRVAPQGWRRGKTLGGSSSINGLMYVRGQPTDFDTLAELTSDDWNWEHIGAAYKAFEDHELGPGDTRGKGGPLRVTLPPTRSPLTEAIVGAGVSMGLSRKDDVNAPDNAEGVGYAARTIYKGRRQSGAVAFLRKAAKRRNLTVITDTVVDRVVFEGTKAVGVACTFRGRSIEYPGREIILSSGTLASPAILQRSGIGPAPLLKRLGIEVLHDLPAVGEGLKEHRAVLVQYQLKNIGSQNEQLRGWRLIKNTFQYYLFHTGAMTYATYEIGAWFKSRPGLNRPNGQFLIAPHSLDFKAQPKMAMDQFPGLQICAYTLRPRSTGTVEITSNRPEDLPKIDLDYFADPEDRREMVEVFRYAREYCSKEPLAKHVVAESWPGSHVQTDDEILDAYGQLGTCAYHAVGTCRMGSDPDSVVDPQTRVRGVQNLRVIDLSIAPFVLAGNTFAPVTALAWRAADLLLAERQAALH